MVQCVNVYSPEHVVGTPKNEKLSLYNIKYFYMCSFFFP